MNEFCTKQAERITALEEGAKSAHLRINKLEENQKVLQEMNINIRLLAEQNKSQNEEMKGIKTDVKELNNKVDRLEEKPLLELSDTYRKVRWLVVSTIIGGIMGYIFNHFI